MLGAGSPAARRRGRGGGARRVVHLAQGVFHGGAVAKVDCASAPGRACGVGLMVSGNLLCGARRAWGWCGTVTKAAPGSVALITAFSWGIR